MDKERIEIVRPKGFGVRHVQTLLLFVGLFLAFTMRANMSMAVVAMTDKTLENHFTWDSTMRGYILSSFFWGYVILQIPGGELARWMGGKRLITISLGVNSLLSLLFPAAAYYGDWMMVCAFRIIQGLTQAFLYPSVHHLISQWVPVEEKGLLTTIIYAGAQLGVAAQLMVSGIISDVWGWKAIFYVNSATAAIWTVAYMIYGSNCPERSTRITREEVAYIQNSLGRDGEQIRHSTPWKKVLTSLPFSAVIIAHCGQNWGFFTLMTEMPTYMSKVLGVDLKSNGFLSSLPYIAMYLLSFPMGAMTDLMIKKNWISVTNTRKLSNTIGLCGPAIALLGLAYVPSGEMALAVFILTIAVGVNAGQYTGYMLVYIDLAQNYSGSLMGIGNFFANIVSIIAPLVCGQIVRDEYEHETAEWRKVFFLAAAVYFFTNLYFVLFTTSDTQPWNEPEEETTEPVTDSTKQPMNNQTTSTV